MNILTSLFENQNKSLSKEELTLIGWPGRVVTANSVIVAIANIRKILRHHFTEEIIFTDTTGYIYHSQLTVVADTTKKDDYLSYRNRNEPITMDEDLITETLYKPEEDNIKRPTHFNSHYLPEHEELPISNRCGILLFKFKRMADCYAKPLLTITLVLLNLFITINYISDNNMLVRVTIARENNWLTITLGDAPLLQNNHTLSVNTMMVNDLDSYLKKINASHFLEKDGYGIKTYYPQLDGIVSQCITRKGVVSSFLPRGVVNEECL